MPKLNRLLVTLVFCLNCIPDGIAQANPQKKPDKKSDAFSPERIRPDAQVPLNPERYIWKLSTKRASNSKNSDQIPVYAFDEDSDRLFSVGSVKAGEVITLDEFRMRGRRNFYRYPFEKNATRPSHLGRSVTFWVEGINVDYAGKK